MVIKSSYQAVMMPSILTIDNLDILYRGISIVSVGTLNRSQPSLTDTLNYQTYP
jgi:hypothetical protein